MQHLYRHIAPILDGSERPYCICARPGAETESHLIISGGLSVGKIRPLIAFNACIEAGDAAGFFLQHIRHDAGPVPGDFGIHAGSGSVAAVMDDICNDLFIRALEGNDRHAHIPGAPGILTENDLSVFSKLTAVDADITFSFAEADFRGLQGFPGLLCRLYGSGLQNCFYVFVIHLAPGGCIAGIGAGMCVCRVDDDIFFRYAGSLAGKGAEFPREGFIVAAEGTADQKRTIFIRTDQYCR